MFKSSLSKFISKKTDDCVVDEFVLTYISKNDPNECFLKSWDEKFQTKIMSSFENVEWNSIVFKLYFNNLEIKFDNLNIKADLVGIKVSRKEKHDEITYKYDLCFHKQVDPQIDAVFTTTYLKRKEENEDGKKVTMYFDTEISK